MNQDLEKFIELLKTDGALQEKMKSAIENYTGEQTPEAAFRNLILPAAEEAGYHITWEDYQEYVTQAADNIRNLDVDEMDQVAGGSTWGLGFGACDTGGIGVGGTGNFICVLIGAGNGAAVCAVKGSSKDA